MSTGSAARLQFNQVSAQLHDPVRACQAVSVLEGLNSELIAVAPTIRSVNPADAQVVSPVLQSLGASIRQMLDQLGI
jgi:hypothetical protein